MPQEYFGIGSIEKLKEILEKEKPKKIFLVTGRKSYTTCGAEEKLKPILSSYQYVRFFDFDPNPKIEDVEKGIEITTKEDIYNCDAIFFCVAISSLEDLLKNSKELKTGSDQKNIMVSPGTQQIGKPEVIFIWPRWR